MADEVIVYTTIDEDFPVAGQDNDSQGFRDNFSVVKTGLSTANTEILALKNNAAKLNVDNAFDGNNISNANFVGNTLDKNTTYASMGSGGAGPEINFNEGAVYIINTGNDSIINKTISVSSFSQDNAGQVRLVVGTNSTSGSTTYTFNSTGATFVTDGNAIWSGPEFTVTSAQTMIVDVFTTDGVTYYLTHVGTYS